MFREFMSRKWIRSIVLLASVARLGAQQPLYINMGTLAPEGSLWHQVFQQMGEQWRTASQGKVKLRIYPGGVQGDEPDMIKRMRLGQLQAVALSNVGLSQIEPAAACLQIPMLLQSYEELDYVRGHVAARLEKKLEAKGYVVLHWGEVGWVHFFAKTPATRLGDFRNRKLFTWAGDNEALELWKAAGFRPIPLAATDILTGLQTGLIDSFDTAPLAALSNQWFGLAKYMVDVRWAPLTGATVVSKSAWERIPEAERPALLQAARTAGDRLQAEIRKSGDEAVAAMKKRGLTVIEVDAAARADWRREAEAIYPKLRGRTVPADMFDEVLRLRDEFRSLPASNRRPT
jgi:TRAP-type C4-dicarboxylate transport system substrate-binding protein